jgi:RNA polymerase sigma-70 factor (ECF subfamily)
LVTFFRHHLPGYLSTDAEDLAQETLTATWAALEKDAENVRDPMHFLRGVARHKVADALRRDHRRRFVPLDELIESPTRALIADASIQHKLLRADLERSLRRALRSLPPVEEQILRLRFCEGLTNEDASRRLGISPAEGSRLKYVALQRLRVILKVKTAPSRPLRLRTAR